MPGQVFQVLQCYSCNTFQVQQKKKTNKWICKMCGEKQSIRKVYGEGTGADCRGHVMKLNTRRGELESKQLVPCGYDRSHTDIEEPIHPAYENSVHSSHQVESQSQAQSHWHHYLENEGNEDESDSDDCSQAIPANQPSRRKSSDKLPSQSMHQQYPSKSDLGGYSLSGTKRNSSQMRTQQRYHIMSNVPEGDDSQYYESAGTLPSPCKKKARPLMDANFQTSVNFSDKDFAGIQSKQAHQSDICSLKKSNRYGLDVKDKSLTTPQKCDKNSSAVSVAKASKWAAFVEEDEESDTSDEDTPGDAAQEPLAISNQISSFRTVPSIFTTSNELTDFQSEKHCFENCATERWKTEKDVVLLAANKTSVDVLDDIDYSANNSAVYSNIGAAVPKESRTCTSVKHREVLTHTHMNIFSLGDLDDDDLDLRI